MCLLPASVFGVSLDDEVVVIAADMRGDHLGREGRNIRFRR